jgi:hypothetical protein
MEVQIAVILGYAYLKNEEIKKKIITILFVLVLVCNTNSTTIYINVFMDILYMLR